MSMGIFLRMIAKAVIIASLVFFAFCSSALAGCGWSTTRTCYYGNDTHGAWLPDNNLSQQYDFTDNSYKWLFLEPGWYCVPATGYTPPPNCCQAYEYTNTWQADPDNACCGSPDPCCNNPNCCTNEQPQACVTVDGCPGNKVCSGGQWSACQSTGDCCAL